MKIIDVPVGNIGEFIVDESAGTLTFELKGTILGQPEDLKINVPLKDVLTGLLAGVSNPFAQWAIKLLIASL